MSLSVGIDFGTSNSAIAISYPGKENFELVPLENQSITIPSAVFYKAPLNEAFFGSMAIDSYISGDDGRLMRSFKRALGTSTMDYFAHINNKWIKFDNIIARFLTFLKEKAEILAGEDITKAVIGRPVNFCDGDNEANIKAQKQLDSIARKTGFKDVEFLYEPIAASFAHEAHIEGEKLALIIDIGGGTSDFTVIRLSSKSVNKKDRSKDILSNSGVRVGGTDFDRQLSLSCFMKHLGLGTTYGNKNLTVPNAHYIQLSEWNRINDLYNHSEIQFINRLLAVSHSPDKYNRLLEVLRKEQGHKLLGFIEKAKISLTLSSRHETCLDFLPGSPIVISSAKEMEEAISKNLEAITNSMKECLKTAKVKTKDIDLIILTGGSTSLPAIMRLVKKNFPEAELSDINRLSSVCIGLAYDAQRKFS